MADETKPGLHKLGVGQGRDGLISVPASYRDGLPVPLTDPINTVDRRLSGFRPSEIDALREARRTTEAQRVESP